MNEKSEKKSEKKSSAVGWGVRVLIWGAVAVFAVFALLDYKGHNDAEATYTAWMKVLNEREEANEDLLLSELDKLVQGTPIISDPTKSDSEGRIAIEFVTVTYVWGGKFRDNSVDVRYIDRADNSFIKRIILPANRD